MKILRSVTRRGFNVGTAGWFTVLRPNSWFPASRFPQTRRIVTGHSIGAESAATTAPRIRVLSGPDRNPFRMGLIALAAIAITSTLLVWIIQAR